MSTIAVSCVTVTGNDEHCWQESLATRTASPISAGSNAPLAAATTAVVFDSSGHTAFGTGSTSARLTVGGAILAEQVRRTGKFFVFQNTQRKSLTTTASAIAEMQDKQLVGIPTAFSCVAVKSQTKPWKRVDFLRLGQMLMMSDEGLITDVSSVREEGQHRARDTIRKVKQLGCANDRSIVDHRHDPQMPVTLPTDARNVRPDRSTKHGLPRDGVRMFRTVGGVFNFSFT